MEPYGLTSHKKVGLNMEGLAAAAFCFALVGVVALVRTEKLIKTLKEKGILDENYKAD